MGKTPPTAGTSGAALAEVYGAQPAPHCPLGPAALAVGRQVAFTTPDFLTREQSLGIHYHRGAEEPAGHPHGSRPAPGGTPGTPRQAGPE